MLVDQGSKLEIIRCFPPFLVSEFKKERLSGMDMYMKTLEYFKPRLNRSEVKHEGTPEIKITYEEKPY